MDAFFIRLKQINLTQTNPIKIVFIFLLSSMFLSACSNDDDDKSKKVTAINSDIVLSADGVGPLNGNTTFNMHQMTVAFSEYSVEEMVNFQSGTPYPVVRVSKGGNTILTINPDDSRENIFSIAIEDNSVSNSLGHSLGTAYSDVYNYGRTEKCQVGSQELSGKVLCYAPKTPNILYVFNGKWRGKENQMPPAEILQDWVLESIIWRPK